MKPILDILFVNPPPSWMNIPPIGLLTMHEYLKANGFNSEVYDLNNEIYITLSETQKKFWNLDKRQLWTEDEELDKIISVFKIKFNLAIKKIIEKKPKVIGFSVIMTKEKLTIYLINEIRKHLPKTVFLVGGPTFHNNVLDLLKKNHIDIITVGEGESIILEIMNRIVSNNSLNEIEGTIVRTGNKYSTYVKKKQITNLDNIPFPKYEQNVLSNYDTSPFPLVWSRGCIAKCSFCEVPIAWNSFQSRSPNHIVQELLYLSREHNIKKFTILDPLLNGNLTLLEEICDKIIALNLKIEWEGSFLCRNNCTELLFTKMAQAGCTRLFYGIESGSNKILKKAVR